MMKKMWVLAIFALAACGEKDAPAPAPKPSSPDKKQPAETKKSDASAPEKAPEKKAEAKKEMHVDERGVSRDPKVYDQFCEIMEAIGAAHKALKKDVEEKKEEATLKAHIKKILESGRKARELAYLKDADKNDDLDSYFNIFDLKMNQFLEDDWAEDKAEGNFERLGSVCRTCHEIWRD